MVKVDALTRINDIHYPGSTGPAAAIVVQASKTGNTWTIPAALASYPRGNVPNTWRIRLSRTPPAGVTYHRDIMQTFVRVGEAPGKTYPPTTR